MTEREQKRKRAYAYIVEQAKTRLVAPPDYSDKRLAEIFDIPVKDLTSLKEGESDPTPELIAAFKRLLGPTVREAEVDLYLVTPFLTGSQEVA